MTTEQLVKDIIVNQLGFHPNDVVTEARFREDLDADSLDEVELVMAFEDEFGIEIDYGSVEHIKTVGELITFIESLRNP